ncbi:MAG: DNA alkylation repair protein [Verrucomicrobia bacterium]|nr:DNA alkylation repair protein [Verrucomicrobiota bacterium]
MKSNDIADEIVSALKVFGRGSRQGHRPSAQEDFGVYTADLRSVVRDYKSRFRELDGEAVYEIMIQKAISWALRVLVPWDRRAVESFLATNEKVVSNRVAREVNKKLLTGKKN